MKLLVVVVVLAMAAFANAKLSFSDAAKKVTPRGFKTMADVGKAVVELNAEEKKKFGEGAAAAPVEDKKCMEQLKPVLISTSQKYLVKMFKGEPIYKKEGKEFNFSNFFTHSKFFKTATSDTCLESLVKNAGKFVEWGARAAFDLLTDKLG